MTTTNTATESISTGVLTPHNFNTTTTGAELWTEGKMRHVITALAGRRVILTVDRLTGHTAFNVRLVSVIPGGGGSYGRVQVEYTHADGTTHRTNHLLFNLGPAIVQMPDTSARSVRWDAVDNYRTEASAAIAVARETRRAHGLDGGYGTLTATPKAHGVTVTFDPDYPAATRAGHDRYAPNQRFWHATITPAQITAELDRRAAYQAQIERERAGVPDTCQA